MDNSAHHLSYNRPPLNGSALEKLADTILEIDFTDMRVHMMKAYAMKLEGKNFKFHKTMVELLENSIFITGDGKSPITEPMKSLAKMFK